LEQVRLALDNYLENLVPGENMNVSVLKDAIELNSEEGEKIFKEEEETKFKLTEVMKKLGEEQQKMMDQAVKRSNDKLGSKVTVNIWAEREGEVNLTINYSEIYFKSSR
jgi:hypothetical protein